MTKDYDEIYKKKIVDKSNGIGAIGRLPSDAEVTSSPAVNGGASCTAGTRRTGEVPGRRSPDLGRQGPCLGRECPAVLSRALPSTDVSLPSGFAGRLSPRSSTGGEPVEVVPYRPIRSQTVSLPSTVERTIKLTRFTPALRPPASGRGFSRCLKIVHTETGGGSSPLYVWYRVPEKE